MRISDWSSDVCSSDLIELSSYQTRDVAASGVRPEVAVVTNVFPEHLDWHGGELRYIADKLALLAEARPPLAAPHADDPRPAPLALRERDVRWSAPPDRCVTAGRGMPRWHALFGATLHLPAPGPHHT